MREYYLLTKPGIIRGNLITAVASFFLASNANIDIRLLTSLIGGVIFVIASGCVFNNILDRNMDSKMERTKKRAIVTGEISIKNAILFGTTLGLCGIAILFYCTTLLATLFGLLGLIFYVVVYGYAKRRTYFSTLVGSISGAIPPVIGYTAVTNNLDIVAILLFLILVAWQMPHFYSIAIYRKNEYEKAGIPLLSIVKGVEVVKKQIIIFTILFFIFTNTLFILGYTNWVYLVVINAVSGWWLIKGLEGFRTSDNDIWAKQMFGISLIVLLVFSVMISIQSFLPFAIPQL